MKRWKLAVLALPVLWLPACDLTDPFGSNGGNNETEDEGDHEELVLAPGQGAEVPAGWGVAETNGVGTPARWRARVEGDGQDLLWRAVSVNPSDTINLVLTDQAFAPELLDVEVLVDVVAEEPSAGLVFCATSGDDHLAAIWNAAAGTLIVVRVEAAKTTVLGSARTPGDVSGWHRITVSLGREHGTVAFDDETRLTFVAPSDGLGQIGLCTRGTADTSFRRLRVARKRD